MRLISLKNIHEYLQKGQKELILTQEQLITPSAKDFLKNEGVAIIYPIKNTRSSQKSFSSALSINNDNTTADQDLIKKITHIIIHKYKITDVEQISKLVIQILNNNNNNNK